MIRAALYNERIERSSVYYSPHAKVLVLGLGLNGSITIEDSLEAARLLVEWTIALEQMMEAERARTGSDGGNGSPIRRGGVSGDAAVRAALAAVEGGR